MTEQKTDPMPKQEPYLYKDKFEAPESFRTLDGGDLSLDQMNWIVQRSYDEQILTTDDRGQAIAWVPQRGHAVEAFRAENRLTDGFWVPKTDEEKRGGVEPQADEKAVN